MGRWSTVVTALAMAVGSGVVSANERTTETTTRGATNAIARVQLTPQVTLVPVDMRVLVQVEPHADNRLLRLVIEADDYYRSTDIQLDGDSAAKSHFITWRGVPPGAYVFSATVYGSTGSRGQRIQRGGGGSDTIAQ